MKRALSGLAVAVSVSTCVMVSCKAPAASHNASAANHEAAAANHPFLGRWTHRLYALSARGECALWNETYEFTAGRRFQNIVVTQGRRRSGRSTSTGTFDVQGSELTLRTETETWIRTDKGPASYTDKPIGTAENVKWRIEGQDLVLVKGGTDLTFYRESKTAR
jgi:hypothetical protein